jgi:hypothetical protein
LGITQAAGAIGGKASLHEGDIWKIEFNYPTEQKQYDDVVITMTSPAGNSTSQQCDFSRLNFEFQEQ